MRSQIRKEQWLQRDGKIKRSRETRKFFKPIRGSVHVTPATDDSEMENAATSDTTDQQDTTLRKSERERRPPGYLQDYVCKLYV